eukprot:CAMPEP_0171729110 /NCGR_PEP_ID=MMETSP0991-20121206/27407_1 /TAXON_ID=483369 /ORGANISM="non described non described, Strain CCMP2098" /LENGTH=358 /DNA_ID=CAMNT_0012323403 /DNA_START=6 /DNA_END=1082 /DNA_ORIENTATION=+
MDDDAPSTAPSGDSAPGVETKATPHHRSLSTNGTSAELPWVEKYRPSTLDELIAHDEIIGIITRLIESGKLPHLLFYGPPGTGKTSTILAAARSMYGARSQAMTLELNASDDRGIGVVRDQIKSFAGTKQLFSSGVKLVILDEADAMTNDAQFALRRVIEKNTKNTRFCLICNYVSKIIPALQSRCTRFRFAPLKPDQVIGRMNAIIAAEGLEVTEEGKHALLDLSGGDMRRVLNVMQAAHMANPGGVDGKAVYLCTGNPLPEDVEAMLHRFLNDGFAQAFEATKVQCFTSGYALSDVLREVSLLVLAMGLPPAVLAQLLDDMSTIEWRLAAGASEKVQLAALVGAFMVARETMAPPP